MNDAKDRKIDFLDRQLYQARNTIIELMPEAKQRLLRSYWHCETRENTYGWLHGVADQLVDMAEPLPSEHHERANCPLCGGGALSWYGEEGFKLEGLRRHLIGCGSKTKQCPVMAEVSELAHDYWESKFHKAEQLEANQRAARVKERKQSETMYAVGPDQDPVLNDESLGFDAVARSDEDMAWAEQRLASLGFKIQLQANVKTYVDEQEAYIVYADPRAKGELQFRVYRKTGAGKTRKPRVRAEGFGFRMPDSWKNALPTKYRQRVAKELGH